MTWASPYQKKRLGKRLRREKRFRRIGLFAILAAGSFLMLLFSQIISQGASGFSQTYVEIPVTFDPSFFKGYQQTGTVTKSQIEKTNMLALLSRALPGQFKGVYSRQDRRHLLSLFSLYARDQLREALVNDPGLIGQTRIMSLLASDEVDQFHKGHTSRHVAEGDRRLNDKQIEWIDQLNTEGRLSLKFHLPFLTTGVSSDPERAGIWGAVVGSALTLMVTLLVAFPVGVLTAVYLEEFAPKSRWTDLLNINIHNLAAVPSIVFGLLGLALFLTTLNLPRSAPIVGGLTLALMTLPTIIIASRSAIKAVPQSQRQAALALGASPIQTVFHHVIPSAMPGILTGSIMGTAQALGETAPLLMIGMVAFVIDIPSSITDAATVLPVQIYLWADSPLRAFQEKTAAAIIVLLFFLVILNATALWLRHKTERRW